MRGEYHLMPPVQYIMTGRSSWPLTLSTTSSTSLGNSLTNERRELIILTNQRRVLKPIMTNQKPVLIIMTNERPVFVPDSADVEAGHDDGQEDHRGGDCAEDHEQGRRHRGQEDRLGGVRVLSQGRERV